MSDNSDCVIVKFALLLTSGTFWQAKKEKKLTASESVFSLPGLDGS